MSKSIEKYAAEIQTRDTDGRLKFFATLTEAMEAAKNDKSIWKVSFTSSTRERVRLTRNPHDVFEYDPIVLNAL